MVAYYIDQVLSKMLAVAAENLYHYIPECLVFLSA